MTNLTSEEQSYLNINLQNFTSGEVGKEDILGSETVSYLPGITPPGTDEKTMAEFFTKFPRWEKKHDWQDAGTGKHFVQMTLKSNFVLQQKSEPSEMTLVQKSTESEVKLMPKSPAAEISFVQKSE